MGHRTCSYLLFPYGIYPIFFQNVNLNLHLDILNYGSPQKLVLALGATIRNNMKCICFCQNQTIVYECKGKLIPREQTLLHG